LILSRHLDMGRPGAGYCNGTAPLPDWGQPWLVAMKCKTVWPLWHATPPTYRAVKNIRQAPDLWRRRFWSGVPTAKTTPCRNLYLLKQGIRNSDLLFIKPLDERAAIASPARFIDTFCRQGNR
jgi:hypothetical protein